MACSSLQSDQALCSYCLQVFYKNTDFEIEYLIIAVGLILFVYNNPEKNYRVYIVISILGIFISPVLLAVIPNQSVGQVIMIISSLGLLIFYYSRFKAKKSNEIIDYIKWIGIILIVGYPWTVYTETTPWLLLRASTLPTIIAIYLYDRWILKPENMKKKYLVTLIAQTVLILFVLMYAFVQKAESDVLRHLGDEQMQMARQNQEECEKAIRDIEHAPQE